MNERIIELAKQAEEYAFGEIDKIQGPAGMFFSKRTFDKSFREKFAHLIVQECANLLVKEAKSSHDEGSETYDTLIRESNWMKRYFGVTE